LVFASLRLSLFTLAHGPPFVQEWTVRAVHSNRTAGAADARFLIHPAASYRQRSKSQSRTAVLRRLSFFLLVLGCTVSLLASGRLSLRLILDGVLSFAFLPATTVAGLAVVYYGHRDRALPFYRALDLFLAGLIPWFLWLLVLGTVCSFVPPRHLEPWFSPIEFSLLVPVVWSTVLDFHFFREAMGRSARAAIGDLLSYRLVAWGGATAYFFGIAIWYEIVPIVFGWLGG
jgi:hypothetical protein